jgi:hypothetical protein
MYLKSYIALACFCWITCLNTVAQSDGSWQPANANLSYPRTLLKAEEIGPVRQALEMNAAHGTIYTGLYHSINTTLPAGNTSHDERRTRATFAKNTAFVLLLDRKPAANAFTSLSTVERSTLIDNVITLLQNINPAVEAFPAYTNWQWRSKELIDYMVAYDLLRGAQVPETALGLSKTKLQEFAGNLYKQSVVSMMGYTFYNSIKNNHALMTASALGLAAVVLNDATSATDYLQPQNWINNGLYNLDNVLWRDARRQSDSTAVAGYAEGPYYFKYAFLNCLPFIRAMGNFLPDGYRAYTYKTSRRSIRNPYHDPKYELLYEWTSAILMPDGRYPALEDSYLDLGMPELALTGKAQYVQPLYLQNLAPPQLNTLNAQLRDLTVDMRAAYLAANIAPAPASHNAITILPKSGNLVFRSGNDSLANYLHLYGKNGLAQTVTGGHNHGDASSFLLHAKGQLLALDAGYLSSGRRDSVGQATNHNLILVDGLGPAIGKDGVTNDAEAFIQNGFNTKQLAYGEVKTAYQNANITRKMLFVRKNYFLLADFVKSATPRNYTWQLHGYGLEGGTATTGLFTDNLATQQEGTWTKNGVSLKAHVTAAGSASAYTKERNIHELSYNNSQPHTTLLVQKNGVDQTQFLALLYPYTTQNATVTTTSTTQTAGLQATEAGYKDLAWTQADTSFTTTENINLPQTITSDALLTFFSVDNIGDFAQVFVDQGTSVIYGSQQLLQSSRRANISWQQNSATQYEGYVSRETNLTLALAEPPTVVVGANIADYSYNSEEGTLEITFTGPSNFGIRTTSTTLPVDLIAFRAQREKETVKLTWQTARESQNAGFTLLRRTTLEKHWTTMAFIAGNNYSQIKQNYTYTDKTAPTGEVYYQLIQVDLDGQRQISPVVALSRILEQTPVLEVYPVPVAGYLQVNLAGFTQAVRLEVLGPDGKILLSQLLHRQATLDLSAFKPGIYYVKAHDTAGRIVTPGKKILISR